VLNHSYIYELLETKYRQFNRESFIETDPVSIPHLFTNKADIELSAFLTATIAWGQRPVILRNATQLMKWMDMSPSYFIRHFKESDLLPFRKFKHRTFNFSDCKSFLRALQCILIEKKTLENAFFGDLNVPNTPLALQISNFKKHFFIEPYSKRSEKHLSNPMSGSAAKRINMFLRWMVRSDYSGVDFGIWKSINPSQLMLPLDVHSGRVARALGLLQRKQNDWKAVVELTECLKTFDKNDPVKYDYALFGLGVFEKFGY
jgi:uncharacterized protein (TIGR02757 family)